MAWYDEAVFYHIYPLGLTGAPKENNYECTEHRLNKLKFHKNIASQYILLTNDNINNLSFTKILLCNTFFPLPII